MIKNERIFYSSNYLRDRSYLFCKKAGLDELTLELISEGKQSDY